MLHRLHRLTNATVQKNDKESTKNSLQFKTLVRQTVNADLKTKVFRCCLNCSMLEIQRISVVSTTAASVSSKECIGNA